MKKNNLKVVLFGGALLVVILAIIAQFTKATWLYLVEALISLAIIGIAAYNVKSKNNITKVLLIVFLGLMVLSWIIPAAYYSGQYQEQGRVQMGLFDMFNYPLTALSYFGFITLFIILVGGFYGVLYKIPAYRTFLDKVTNAASKNKKVSLSVMVILLAVLVSFCGLQIGIALFIPFLVAIILMMGYDKITAALVTVGGVAAGLIGSSFANSNLSVLTQTLNLKLNYSIWVRLVILLAAIIVVIVNVVMYVNKGNKVKKAAKKPTGKAAKKEEAVTVVKSDLLPGAVKETHSTWPFVVTFILLFVITVLAFISWDAEGIGVRAFTDLTKNVTELELFKFPIFAKILGTVNAFGAWTLTDMFVPLALVVLILALIYKVSVEDVVEGFLSGAKKALGPALVSILVYSVLVLVTYHPFQLVIYNVLLGMTKGFNILTTTVIAILASMFNADMSYTFQSVLPYYATQVTNLKDFSLVGIIFTSMYGLTMLVAPTSLVLMGTLSYLNVSYKDWLKAVWKLLVELFVILLLVFIILALI